MIIDFYDVKGTYLTEVELTESEVKLLVRYAILDILKIESKKAKKNINKIKEKFKQVDNVEE